MRIICDKHVIFHYLLHHRMPPVLDMDQSFFIDHGAYIMIPLRHKGERGKYIQPCHSLCGLLNPLDLPADGIPYLTEQIVFQRGKLILRIQDRIFEFLQTGGRITFRIGESLLAHIIVGHHIFKRIGHFKIIAEHFIIFDLKVFNAGTVSIFLLQRSQPVFSLGLCFPERIYRLVKPVFDNAALPHQDRRIFLYRRTDQSEQFLQRIDILPDL